MGTSRSAEADDWTVVAQVFSGRPDPQWSLPARQAGELVAAWRELPSWNDAAPQIRPLGYRGMLLRSPDRELWLVYGAAVGQHTLTGWSWRRDQGKLIERTLVKSAPPDALPPDLASDIRGAD